MSQLKNYFDNSADYYSCQILKTRYFERFGTDEECNEAYREFYESRKKINQTDDFMRVHHVLSRLELTQAQLNRDAMRRENMELQNTSYVDELTKLYNRRYLSRQLEQIAMMGADVRLGCVILDVDYFKQYNDFYGHFKGDSALQHVGSLLKQQLFKCADQALYMAKEKGRDCFVKWESVN